MEDIKEIEKKNWLYLVNPSATENKKEIEIEREKQITVISEIYVLFR